MQGEGERGKQEGQEGKMTIREKGTGDGREKYNQSKKRRGFRTASRALRMSGTREDTECDRSSTWMRDRG